jgi:hypothetical protein
MFRLFPSYTFKVSSGATFPPFVDEKSAIYEQYLKLMEYE